MMVDAIDELRDAVENGPGDGHDEMSQENPGGRQQ
jgi:hypothetical protein